MASPAASSVVTATPPYSPVGGAYEEDTSSLAYLLTCSGGDTATAAEAPSSTNMSDAAIAAAMEEQHTLAQVI